MTRPGAPRQPEQTRPRLELVWPGKDQFLLTPSDANGKPVWVEPDHPAASEVRISDLTGTYGQVNPDDPYADNLLFTGDSLDVLRILTEVPEYRQHYRGKVKLIYIDPPFNTGQTFTHYDDWMEHSTWLSFMRDRLLLAKELLAQEGSLWVHLDDAEAHRMRCLLDEVFGAQNSIADLTVELNPKGRQLDRFFAGSNDRLLVYARQWSECSMVCASAEDVNPADFPQIDSGGRRYRRLPLRNTNKRFNPQSAPTMHYPLFGDPTTGLVSPDRAPGLTEVWPVFGDGSAAVWRWSKKKVAAQKDELICRNVRGKEGERVDLFQMDYLTPDRVKKIKTIWLSSAIGSSDEGKNELKSLFPGATPFSTPKPERLLERVIHIGSSPGDIVVDVFGGSGTTAAVAHKMGRRWVTAEILPDTVAAFTEPRLRKVVDGEQGGISEKVGWSGGGGFRTVTVGPSMYESTQFGVLLADWATNGRFSRAVAGQLGFTFQPDASPFCGQRGRMRLAVLDGAVGPQEVREIVGALGDRERVTVVAKMVLPDAERVLKELSPGSRVRKAPRDVLNARRRRRTTSLPADTVDQTSDQGRGGDA